MHAFVSIFLSNAGYIVGVETSGNTTTDALSLMVF